MTGDELKAWRVRLGFTQTEAAAQLFIKPRQYQRLEAKGQESIKPGHAQLAMRIEVDKQATG